MFPVDKILFYCAGLIIYIRKKFKLKSQMKYIFLITSDLHAFMAQVAWDFKLFHHEIIAS